LVDPDRAKPGGGGDCPSAQEPVGQQDDSGEEERAELDFALFRLGIAHCVDTIRHAFVKPDRCQVLQCDMQDFKT
jgi:hypothetical protein